MSLTRRAEFQDEENSTTKVIATLMVMIALFAWASAAAAYSHAKENWRYAEANSETHADGLVYDKRFKGSSYSKRGTKFALKEFIWNAFRQVPNVVSVIAFNFQHRLWLVILFTCLEGGALFLGYVMSKID